MGTLLCVERASCVWSFFPLHLCTSFPRATMGQQASIDKAEAKRIASIYEIDAKRVIELNKNWRECAGKKKNTLNKKEFTAWCISQNIVPDVVTGERIFEQLDEDGNGE